MPHNITDETVAYMSILAKLELSASEKQQVKKDIADMLTYINKLNELDTQNIEPMSHIFPITNVFREDVPEKDVTVTENCHTATDNCDIAMTPRGRDKLLRNAPAVENGMFKVPSTVEQEGT